METRALRPLYAAYMACTLPGGLKSPGPVPDLPRFQLRAPAEASAALLVGTNPGSDTGRCAAIRHCAAQQPLNARHVSQSRKLRVIQQEATLAYANASKKLSMMASVGCNPGSLKSATYIPPSFPHCRPLVVVLHGSMQTAEDFNYGSGWSTLADQHCFALLFPQQRRSNNAIRAFNRFEQEQWQALHRAEEAPTRTNIVDGYPRRVWCDSGGGEVIEEYRIPNMGHGAPLQTVGANGLLRPTLENCVLRGLFVEMERLRIEFGSESPNLIFAAPDWFKPAIGRLHDPAQH